MPINFFKHIASPDDDKVIKITPPDELKEFVEGFYVFQSVQPDGRQLFFNDGYPVIAFMRKTDKKVKISVEGCARYLDNIWVCGGLLKNIYCETSYSFEHLFVVRFYPFTFFRLFELRPNCFEKRQIFNLSEIVKNGFKKFSEAYYGSSSMEERIRIISAFISEKTGLSTYPKILADLLSRIDQPEILSLRDLMKTYAAQLNYKWLERNFKTHLGLSPKNYFLVRRFLAAYLDLHSHSSKDLLEVAMDHGYYDDNHFIKDFKRFSGISPKRYFQEINQDILSSCQMPLHKDSLQDLSS